MAANEKLAQRVREALVDVKSVEEKKMFNGICFMVNDKMCVCVSKDELMCRVGPEKFDEALERNGTRMMEHNGRAFTGYVFASEIAYKSKKDFDYWINLCLAFNKDAKSSKEKRRPKRKKVK
jgi:TfoX/Sxy family transcriptional regulator of competence genes